MTMASDLAQRSSNIEWPCGFEPETADLFAHNAITIAAAPSEVWPHIIAVAAWPTSFANARVVVIEGGLPELRDEMAIRAQLLGENSLRNPGLDETSRGGSLPRVGTC